MPVRLPVELDGRPSVGTLRVQLLLREPITVQGASYKLVKTLSITGCPGSSPWGMEERLLARVSPLLDSRGRPLLPVRRGWAREPWTPRPVLVSGPVELELGWYWRGARFVEALLSCIEGQVADIRVVGLEIEPLRYEPIGQAEIRLVTPAQIKFHGYILPCPPAWRLLRRPLELAEAGEDSLREAAVYLEATDARYEKVTVYFDEERPTNWAVRGRARLTLSPYTPEDLAGLIGGALQIAKHIGIGKSRLEGLGWVRVSASPG